MRKIWTLPLAALLALVVAAPVAAGPNVGNYSSSVTMAQGSWSVYDEETGRYREGYLAVSQEQGSTQAFAEFFQYGEQWIQCTGTDTPDDPEDDTFGSITTYAYGWAPADLSIGKSNATANATASMDIGRDRYDGCTGEWTFEYFPAVAVSIELVATSGTVRESGRGSFHLPGEFNSHSSYRATYRFAEGTVTVGDTVPVWGMIGKVSWMDHSNS